MEQKSLRKDGPDAASNVSDSGRAYTGHASKQKNKESHVKPVYGTAFNRACKHCRVYAQQE